jgi:hypothetical protein
MTSGELLEHALDYAASKGYTPVQIRIMMKLAKEQEPMRITHLAAAARTTRCATYRALAAFPRNEIKITRDKPLRPLVHLETAGKIALMELLKPK